MIKTNKELASAAEAVARNYKTKYVLGAFGWPMTQANKQRAIHAYAFNRKDERKAAIQAATADTFGFDCVCFIKALLWGWCGDAGKEYGGAVYQSNGTPDIGEKAMLDKCTDVSEDFTKLQVGEYLWTDGHCGIYVGEGKAVECTYRWEDGVQITTVYNQQTGGDGRYWKKHGKLPCIAYEDSYSLDFRYLRKGSRGVDVSAVQRLLIDNGYTCGNTGFDGEFGTNTEKAVKAFQTKCGILSDGIVGPDTMRRLIGAGV